MLPSSGKQEVHLCTLALADTKMASWRVVVARRGVGQGGELANEVTG